MDPQVANKLAELDAKIDRIYTSVEKTRKYIAWTLIISLVVIVIPSIGLIFVIPKFINSLQNSLPDINSLISPSQ